MEVAVQGSIIPGKVDDLVSNKLHSVLNKNPGNSTLFTLSSLFNREIVET